jgi:hypothetical protein
VVEVLAMKSNLRKFPLLRGKRWHYPVKPVCPSCGRKRVFEPHSFAVFSFGALLKASKTSAGPDRGLAGFCGLTWHGAHDGGLGQDADISVHVPLAEEVVNGQGEFYFCSPACLRRFMNRSVDELERRIKRERGRAALRGRR